MTNKEWRKKILHGEYGEDTQVELNKWLDKWSEYRFTHKVKYTAEELKKAITDFGEIEKDETL